MVSDGPLPAQSKGAGFIAPGGIASKSSGNHGRQTEAEPKFSSFGEHDESLLTDVDE